MIRDAFIATAAEARALIASRDVARRWDQPSALAEMTIGALAGHLARSVLLPEIYLAEPEPAPDARLLTADQYFDESHITPDLGDDLNVGIRSRAAQDAADGVDALIERLDAAREWSRSTLPALAADRRIAVRGQIPMLLDEYLVTRLLELAVHIDDLCVSVGRATPDFDPVTAMCALGCMLQLARTRHGDLAVLRAMARRERDAVGALRVF